MQNVYPPRLVGGKGSTIQNFVHWNDVNIDILKLFFWSDHLTRKARATFPHHICRYGTVPGTEEVRQQGRYPIQTKCMVELLLLLQ
jgi:hypothetical protein